MCNKTNQTCQTKMLHSGWLQGWGWANLHYAFNIIHLEGYQFADYRRDGWKGKQNSISIAGKELGNATWKGTRYSRAAQDLFLKKMAPITHFLVFWGRTCMLNITISNGTVTLRPLKKSETDFLLMKAFFFLRSCSFNIVPVFILDPFLFAVCAAYPPASCISLPVWI